MDTWNQTLSVGALLGIATFSVILILFLIIKIRLHPFLTLILVSFFTAIATGIPFEFIVNDVLLKSFSSTLGNVALLVGLGAMLGRLIEISGGAKSLANLLINTFGEKNAAFALGIASLLFGFPIFFDSGLIVMLPIVFATARRLKSSLLPYGLASIGAFSVMHVFLPPHPGAIAASSLFGANIGYVIILGLPIAFITWYFSSYLLGQILGKKIHISIPDFLSGGKMECNLKAPLSAKIVILIMFIPLILIFMNTGLSSLISAQIISQEEIWVKILKMLGITPIALLISVLITILILKYKNIELSILEKVTDGALGPICSVILITGAGGMFGGVLRASGIGNAISESIGSLNVPIIFACFIVALALRIAQGSATVALITASSLMLQTVTEANFNEWQLVCIVLATAAGSVGVSHFNDSGFWLVGRLMGMNVQTTLKTWTVNQTLISIIGFILATLAFSFF